MKAMPLGAAFMLRWLSLGRGGQGHDLRRSRGWKVCGSWSLQSGSRRFPVPQVGPHQDLPEAAVVGHAEVQQLVDDHQIPELLIERQQIGAEVQAAEP